MLSIEKIIIIIIILISIKTSYCQDLPDSLSGSKESSVPKESPVNEIFSISFETVFNDDDFMMGFLPGIHLQSLDLTVGALFLFRPYKKKILVEKSTNFYYQFKEWRYVFGICVAKNINLVNTIALSLTAGGGYSFGNYSGTSTSAETTFLPILRIGLTKEFGNTLIGLRYQFIEIPHVNNHQVNLSFEYLLK
jgi:hypothetical protein